MTTTPPPVGTTQPRYFACGGSVCDREMPGIAMPVFPTKEVLDGMNNGTFNHGSAVAGTIVGSSSNSIGIAPGAKFISQKVLETPRTTAANGADIVSNSWGSSPVPYSIFSNKPTISDTPAPSKI